MSTRPNESARTPLLPPTATPERVLRAGTTEPRAVGSWPAAPSSARPARVLRVVDGDTIVLAGIDVGRRDSSGRPGRQARLIGVDTPEVYGGVECYARLASAFTKRLIARNEVLVDFDVGQLDRYSRALVYVWRLDGTFVNGALVREGYASQMTVPPNVRYARLFTQYAAEARNARRGLWSAC